ncbi:hypothetical protein BGW36DRAFT_377840 [Talaromyces proteolyticus]|uniref:SnoaL-like domain-containing protein n=1 Tax=Talaromyces proteolyticus TaxID=1131652 RepID=A0AAD4KRW5_9EURO|nr:uncharacterized protein BGW36DRAFT_377840 [Talaromyces proteolyticus]KAH8697047.1 hypothetical protein BGW36DRAFT_377840 [Talaromyces proteolyticus]
MPLPRVKDNMAASKLLETAKKFIGQFATFDTQTLDNILSENYTHHFAPESLSSLGPYTKKEFLDHHRRMLTIMSGFPVMAKEYIQSESRNQVVVWATSQAIFRDEVKDDTILEKDWMYEGEYMFILSMDETGEKIVRGVEFLDSKATIDTLLGLMKRAQENKEQRVGKGADIVRYV